MKCGHCMRGEAQNRNIKLSYITDVFKQIGDIEHLNITGGEPSLNVPAIRFIVKKLKDFNIKVERLDMITNGSIASMSKDFIEVCNELYNYQNEYNRRPFLMVSGDKYHDKTYYEDAFSSLSCHPFFNAIREKEEVLYLIRSGPL